MAEKLIQQKKHIENRKTLNIQKPKENNIRIQNEKNKSECSC